MNSGTPLAVALQNWAALQSIGKKPRTQTYHQEIVSYILDRWTGDATEDVAAIPLARVTEFVIKVGVLSATRFNAVVSVLRATIPAAVKVKRRPVRCKERAILSPDQLSELVNEMDSARRSHGGLLVRFLVNTGLRINEARQLKWTHVHHDRICLPGSITKNGRPRSVPFVTGTREVLNELRRVGDGEHVLPQAEVKTSLLSACRRLGLPRLTHHDFRHMFATRCIESGVDIPTVARWLGHTDGGALLQRLYFHLVEAHSQAMALLVRPATPGAACVDRSGEFPPLGEHWRN